MATKKPQMLVRLPEDLDELVRREADRQDRSVSGQMTRIVREWAACKTKRPPGSQPAA